MKNWFFLALAIVSEVIGTSALKSSAGFTRLMPAIVVVICYGLSFYLLAQTLKGIPVAIAYAVWSGLGLALITAVAWLYHGQKPDLWGFFGIGLIVSGVLVLNLLSKMTVD